MGADLGSSEAVVRKSGLPEEYRMLIVYVNRNDTDDVKMDRGDFADWEIGPLLNEALGREFGMRLEGEEELNGGG